MPDLPYSHEVSDARIKRLMAQVGMPDSTSLMLAMKQLENEVRLEFSPIIDALLIGEKAEVKRLQEELASEKRVGNILMEAAKQAAAERDQVRQWVADLQSGMFVNCVYCGHRYGPKSDTPVAMADVLKAHIVECPKHPLSIVTKALSCLVETKRHKDQHGKTPAYEKLKEGAWEAAEAALVSVLPPHSCYNKSHRRHEHDDTGWQPR